MCILPAPQSQSPKLETTRSLPSTISGQPLTVYSFCGQPALSSSSCVQSQFSLRPQPLPVTSWPVQVTPSLFQQAASFASERCPPRYTLSASFFVCMRASCPQYFNFTYIASSCLTYCLSASLSSVTSLPTIFFKYVSVTVIYNC